MTTSIRTTSEYLLVAIDVAKRVHEVLIRWPSGESSVGSGVVGVLRDFFSSLLGRDKDEKAPAPASDWPALILDVDRLLAGRPVQLTWRVVEPWALSHSIQGEDCECKTGLRNRP